MSRNIPKATIRLLILLICNAVFFLSLSSFGEKNPYFKRKKMLDEFPHPEYHVVLMKENVQRENAPTQGQVSDAGPAAYFKAHHLEE